jgi:hypothetical protein
MEQQVSRFQERTALLLAGATLLRLAFGKSRPFWGGIMVLGMGSLLLRAGVVWLHSEKPGPREVRRQPRYVPPFDIVTEDSEESFPASDPPAWALGVAR